jgi:hypothetical protein
VFTVEEALCSVIWYSAVDGYAERDNRDAFTRIVYREAAATAMAVGGGRGEFLHARCTRTCLIEITHF